MKYYEQFYAHSTYSEDKFEGDGRIYGQCEGKEECSPAELPFRGMIAPCNGSCLLRLEILTFFTPNFTFSSLYIFS